MTTAFVPFEDAADPVHPVDNVRAILPSSGDATSASPGVLPAVLWQNGGAS